MSAPSLDVVRQVIEAAERGDPRLALLLMLAALTGMRRVELCTLRWSDADLDPGKIDVNRSVVIVPGGVAEKSTKTNKGRPVALDPVGIALLTQHRTMTERCIAGAGAVRPLDSFVFVCRGHHAVPAGQCHLIFHPCSQ